QISSLISLFVLALYITNKSQEKNRKQALQDQDTIKTRQLFMSASEKLAEIGSFELNIKTKVMHTSEGFRNLFGLPSTSELISIRTILKRFDKTERRKIISNLKQLNLNNTA
ncbi:hypothetical protein, partial [Donghicola sp. XS_ASV15]|uniref:hypothetical protein n=1 Tax=Donghicola sp. XS_ASV15 TaxID=3241295 RepID=UPI0035187F21